MTNNDIASKQNEPAYQRLLRARSRMYQVAARYQIAQLILSVAAPLAAALIVVFEPEYRASAAIVALGITIFDTSIVDRGMRKRLGYAARVSEQFDCELLRMEWNSFAAGKRLPLETVTAASENWKGGDERLRNWYPPEVAKAPLHFARLICQHTNLWYDSTLRRTYSSWLFWIGLILAIAYIVAGFVQKLTLPDWANNIAICAPVVIWTVREFFRQNDTADAVEAAKSNAECIWDDAVAGKIDADVSSQQSREFQNAIFVRRSNNPLLFPLIYRLRRNDMENKMNASAVDRLRAIGLA